MAGIRAILERTETIAVVGFSTDPSKAAYRVPVRLMDHGYEVIPINPNVEEILGRRAYKQLSDLEEAVDLVVVFRPPAEAEGIAREAIALGAKALWLQLRITSEPARRLAEEAGLGFVEDACIAVEIDRLQLLPRWPDA